MVAAELHGEEMVMAMDQEGDEEKRGGKITENLREDGNKKGLNKKEVQQWIKALNPWRGKGGKEDFFKWKSQAALSGAAAVTTIKFL